MTGSDRIREVKRGLSIANDKEANDHYGSLIWNGRCGAGSTNPEPSHFIYETSGDIQQVDDLENELVGKFSLYYVDIARATKAGVALFEVLDTDSTTIDYFEPLYGSNAPWLRDRVSRLIAHDGSLGNLLILDRLEILPSYRGKSIGLLAMAELIAQFSMGAPIVAIKPFPLQFEAVSSLSIDPWRRSLELEGFPQHQRLATAKLVSHYSELGFVRLSRTPFMVKATT